MPKNLGKKNCELSEDHIRRICDTYFAFHETEHSKIPTSLHRGKMDCRVSRGAMPGD